LEESPPPWISDYEIGVMDKRMLLAVLARYKSPPGDAAVGDMRDRIRSLQVRNSSHIHSGNIQGNFKEHSVAFREHLMAFRENSGYKALARYAVVGDMRDRIRSLQVRYAQE
jgi:hypothetical protein